MKKIIIILAVTLLATTAFSQVAINTDGSTPNSSAMLDVKSTDKGFLPPRVANVNAVSSPVAGLQVYDEFNHCMRFYNGSEWSDCMGGSATCPQTVTDFDNNTYDVVKIGTQCWMTENLNVGTMINGSGSQINNGVLEKYCYNDSTSNCDTYGGLYQWGEMMNYSTAPGTQGICPTGWHLPTDDEWKTLEMHLGMTQAQADVAGWRGTDEGSKMAGNEPLWTNGNLDQNANFGTSGFDALPGGYRYSDGSFYLLTTGAHFWSSSTTEGGYAWSRFLFYIYAQVLRYYEYTGVPAVGCSVRCVRD